MSWVQELHLWTQLFWERFRASDPGLTRLRLAAFTTIGAGTTLAVEWGFTTATHASHTVGLASMVLGTLVAMRGTSALPGTGLSRKVKVGAFFPVAIGAGLSLGVMVHHIEDLMLALFVLVMFAAVAVRRFGPIFLSYGFLGWMGYFFASFIGPTPAMLPHLLAAVFLAAAWVLLLSATVLQTRPSRTVARMVGDFAVRSRMVVELCAELLAAQDPERRRQLRRRLRTRRGTLSEAALMVEAWSAEAGALLADRSGPALRRRLIDVQHVIDQMVGRADRLADQDAALAFAASAVAQRLAHQDGEGARRAARLLAVQAEASEGAAGPAGHAFAQAALEYADLAAGLADPASIDAGADPRLIDEFQPVVGLSQGNLPGSPAVARQVPARGVRWNPLARLDLPTRQAIQVAVAGALAIFFGRELSPTRYYWALIAAFVMFTGTATRTETFLKGFQRVLGTLCGLVAAIWLAELTGGRIAPVLAVILGSVFLGFYLLRISYTYLIFFFTIMLGQLYSVLHEFSSGLLLLRLEETVIGAAIGFAVAFFVVPLATEDTVRAARNNLLATFSGLLDAASDRMGGGGTNADFDALTRTLDDRLRALMLVSKPLTRPLVGPGGLRVRHRLALYASIITGSRAIAVTLRDEIPWRSSDLAAFGRILSEAARSLARTAPGSPRPAWPDGHEEPPHLQAPPEAGPGAELIVRRLLHLRHVLADLSGHAGDPL